MKAITEITPIQKATNCDGPNQWFNKQDFEVEANDVGTQKHHYLGHQHAVYQFLQSDVGRHLRVTTQGASYNCWSFLNVVDKIR